MACPSIYPKVQSPKLSHLLSFDSLFLEIQHPWDEWLSSGTLYGDIKASSKKEIQHPWDEWAVQSLNPEQTQTPIQKPRPVQQYRHHYHPLHHHHHHLHRHHHHLFITLWFHYHPLFH